MVVHLRAAVKYCNIKWASEEIDTSVIAVGQEGVANLLKLSRETYNQSSAFQPEDYGYIPVEITAGSVILDQFVCMSWLVLFLDTGSRKFIQLKQPVSLTCTLRSCIQEMCKCKGQHQLLLSCIFHYFQCILSKSNATCILIVLG